MSEKVADPDKHPPASTTQPSPPDTKASKHKDVVRDNAPRIVGIMKFIPDIFLFLSGLRDTGKAMFRSTAAVGFMISRSLLLKYGSKDRKNNKEEVVSPYKDDPSFTGRLKYNLHKVMHPSQYPVESAAGVATLAGVSVALSGASQMRRPGTFKEGIIEFLVGVFTALAEGNVLFGKEKEKSAAGNTSEKSTHHKPKGFIQGIAQKLKDQPVLLSGIAQAGISGSQIGLGLMTLARSKKDAAAGQSKSWYYLAAASIYTAADLVYAFLVRKNEFNVETSTNTPAAEQKPTPMQTLPAEPEKPRKVFAKDAPKSNWETAVQPPAEQDANRSMG